MAKPGDTGANRLADESSLYLRQHMHNPVDWYPWGPEALEAARVGDKPLLVSIGYSACHWCHVMEHESFEDPEIAALMNRSFVCIKVDREERPDVDQIYMDAVVRSVGHGGWPLNVFCTPDGRPFYGGTYFPPTPRHGMPAFRQVLESLANAYRDQRADVEKSAAAIVEALGQRPKEGGQRPAGGALISQAAQALMSTADGTQGGFGDAPKFPTPTNLDMLLASREELPQASAQAVLEQVILTCRSMARGGIYDHLGGGFHRYSVDAEWLVPHFEKMLYDQGQLIRTYAEAWRQSGAEDDSLVWPIRETVDYLRREMAGEEGAFFASQDADSEGVEGKFYVWQPDEVAAVIGEEPSRAFSRAYDVSPGGNFEGQSILRDLEGGRREPFTAEREALRLARSKRVAPATDEKRVTAWNGLLISGLARAGSTLGDDSMVAEAARTARTVLDRARDERGRLLRIFDEGPARISGFLDDVAAMLEACLDLYRAGAGDGFLSSATELAEDVAARFYDPAERDLFLTPADGESLAIRPRSDHDGATPHSAGLAVLGLLRVAALTGRAPLAEVAEQVLDTHAPLLTRAPHAFPTLVRAALLADRGGALLLVVGEAGAESTSTLTSTARRQLAPEVAVVVASPNGSGPTELDAALLADRPMVDDTATAYLCRGRACSLPFTDPGALAAADEQLRGPG